MMVNILGTEFSDLELHFTSNGYVFDCISVHCISWAARCLKVKKSGRQKKKKGGKIQGRVSVENITVLMHWNIWQSKAKSWLRQFVMYLSCHCTAPDWDCLGWVFISFFEFVVVDSSVCSWLCSVILASQWSLCFRTWSSSPILRMPLQCCHNLTSMKWQELQHFCAQKYISDSCNLGWEMYVGQAVIYWNLIAHALHS